MLISHSPYPPRLAPVRHPSGRLRILVAILALVVTASAIAVYETFSHGEPPSGVSTNGGDTFVVLYQPVGGGQVNLALPLLDEHNPDNSTVKSVSFYTYLSFSSGSGGLSEINYTWITGPTLGLPVVVTYDPAEPVFAAGPQWFVATPGGSCNDTCEMEQGWGTYSNLTSFAIWQILLIYTVYRATLVSSSGSYSWLEVRYHTGSSVSSNCLVGAYCSAPLNLSDPGAPDLEAVGPPRQLNVDSRSGQEPTIDVHDLVDPARLFHTVFAGPTFDAGTYGPIRTRLRSSFAWGQATEETLRVTGVGNVTIQMYLDTRFGGMYPVRLA